MEIGKRICQALKELRKRIADANIIPFDLEECTHKGDCLGTCPKCESEVSYLMDSIDKLEQAGKPVTLEGIMSEEELCKAFTKDPIEQSVSGEQEEMATIGMPESPEPLALEDDIEPFRQLVGLPDPPPELMRKRYPTNFIDIVRSLLSLNKGNFVFSPAGLCSILKMLQEGMDANSELFDKIDKIILGLNNEIEPVNDERLNLSHATSIWYNKEIGAIKEKYLNCIKDVYGADAYNADFTQTTKTKLGIDKWVSDKTHHMIKSLDTELSKDAFMIILDAIYMKAKWDNPFDPGLTEMDIFHNDDESKSVVDMMYQDIENAEYGETEEYQVINLPYNSNKYYMTVVLPKKGNYIDEIMNFSDWLYKSTEERIVELYMPRFKFDNTLSFKDILTILEFGDLFEKEDSFPFITDLPFHISQIQQQCVIDVEEDGTEAAAITNAECEVGCPPPDEISRFVTMRIDRPFGFAIRGEYNQILFLGVVRDLSKRKK